jgi:H+-transporting ATPase
METELYNKVISADEAKKISIQELFEKLDSGKDGLTSSEADTRFRQVGPNIIAEKKKNPLIKFLMGFWGPIPWMIEIAAILSAAIKHWEDFWIIAVLLVINAVVGFWQEFKADNAIELLKKKLAINARVLRDKKWITMPANQLVPGDVIHVRLGDIIPADIKLIEDSYIEVDQSALTGESLPVEKKLSDSAYSGSIIRRGEIDAVVFATGMNTYFGKTAKLISEEKSKSHFQKAVIKIGNYLIVFAFVLVMIILLVALYRHESFMDILRFSLVLIVAAIPAALPAVLSVTMAVGAIALAKKEAIVSKLASIEEMAGMDILCADKTGTITQNELTMADVLPMGKFSQADCLLFASLASNRGSPDPIDSAIFNKSDSINEIKEKIPDYTIVSSKPFDPVVKRSEALVKDKKGKTFKVTKGAPQVILELSTNKDKISSDINVKVNDLASKGYRTLGVAVSYKDEKWQYAGLIPMYDPPRSDSAETIHTAQSMGVEVKMVTGDHTAIARETARQVDLGTNIMPSEAILGMSDRQSVKVVEEANGFAQVFPEHKFHIVELLQHAGHIVGMTGDGVNDAPALKKADAGIAVAGATDAAKSAADIVLTKPGLSVIIDAIQQSRKIFQRMNNYAIYRIAETIRVLLFITISIITFKFYPVTALMIVLLALLNDAPIMTIAYDNVHYSDTPDRWNMRTTLGIATFLGIIGVFSSFGIMFIGKEMFHLNNDILQSFIYLKLSVAGHLTVFVARTKRPFWSIKPAVPLLLAVIITQFIATLITVYGFLLPAMGWNLALFVWSYAIAAFLITDLLKVKMYEVFDNENIKFKR